MKSIVLINLFGGPSHIDLFDMKPDAPEDVRGQFKPIATSVPGTSICEHLPRTAKWMDHSSLLRTVTHNLNSHAGREHWTQYGFCLLTGGGIQPGSVYGKSDNIGAYPEVDPVSPGDLVTTLYPLLGIDPAMNVPDLFGRPAHIAHGGRPLQAILARSTTVGARLRNSAAAAHLLRTTVRSERSPVRCLKSGVCYPILRRPGTRHAYARSKLRQRQPAAH